MKVNIQKCLRAIVPVITIFVFLLSVFAFPISAEETTTTWYNVLDYSSANNTGGNYFSFTGTTTVSYELPAAQFITYVDIVFMSLRPITSVTLDMPSDTAYEPQNLLLTELSHDGNYYFYSLHGPVYSARFYQIDLNFVAETSYETYVEIYSFRTSSAFIAVPLSWDFVSSNFMADGADIVPARDDALQYISGISADLCEVLFKFHVYGARKVNIVFMGTGISELFVFANSEYGNPISLPFTLEYFAKYSDFDYYIVSVDLSGIDISEDYISVGIQFASNDSTVGFLPPYLYYPHDDYDSLYPYYYGIVEELKAIDADLAALLTAILESKQLPDNFGQIISDIEHMLSDIRNGFGSSLLEFEEDFDNIQAQLEEILSGSQEDQDKADDLNNNIQDSVGDMNDAMDDIDKIEKPDTGDIDTSLEGLIGEESVNFVNEFLGRITGSVIVSAQLVVVVTLMFVSYVLFGKKG